VLEGKSNSMLDEFLRACVCGVCCKLYMWVFRRSNAATYTSKGNAREIEMGNPLFLKRQQTLRFPFPYSRWRFVRRRRPKLKSRLVT